MLDWLASAARDRPDHPFLIGRNETVSFGDFEVRVRLATGALSSAALDGQVVGLWASNTVPTVVHLFALWRVGATVLLLDPRRRSEETANQIAAAGAGAILGAPDDGARHPGVLRLSVSADGPPAAGRLRTEDETAWVVFTSGSTGRPRGVELTFGNLEASARASAAAIDHRPTDRWLCSLPISHVGGASILVRSARAATTVILEPRFDATSVAGLLVAGSATVASLVSATLLAVLERLDRQCRGVRAVLVGGGPVPFDLVRRAWDRGLPALVTYGMTETASQVATAPLGSGPIRGLEPVPGAELAIDDDGVVLVRGAMVSPRYLGGPDRPADAWHRTGDLGTVDALGRLEIHGRADDVIVTGGENVHPAEIEALLAAHPAVDEVVALGVADPRWGSVVAAFYTGRAAPGELERHARYHLAGSKVPRRWFHVESMPRLSNGKVDRQALLLAHT